MFLKLSRNSPSALRCRLGWMHSRIAKQSPLFTVMPYCSPRILWKTRTIPRGRLPTWRSSKSLPSLRTSCWSKTNEWCCSFWTGSSPWACRRREARSGSRFSFIAIHWCTVKRICLLKQQGEHTEGAVAKSVHNHVFIAFLYQDFCLTAINPFLYLSTVSYHKIS